MAAGQSRRMGWDKLLHGLHGTAVLKRTVDVFLRCEEIDEVVVVCPEDRWAALEFGKTIKPLKRVDGGEERQYSVANGLDGLSGDVGWVAIHDGARPLLHIDDLKKCIQEAKKHMAASLAKRAVDTMKRGDEDDFCVESVSREQLWCMETPQIFAKEVLMRAYLQVSQRGLTVTDEVSAVQELGVRVKLVEAAYPNFKITTPADIKLAEAWIENQNQ